MLLPVIDAPVLFEVGGPALVPRILADGARRRTQCEDIDEHPLIIADPIVRAEIAAFATFGIPAHRDRLDRKSTRLNSSTNAHLVCRLLLEKKTKKII